MILAKQAKLSKVRKVVGMQNKLLFYTKFPSDNRFKLSKDFPYCRCFFFIKIILQVILQNPIGCC